MRLSTKFVFVFATVLALASCGPTKYVHQTQSGRYGYGESKVDSTTWLVYFSANYRTSIDVANRYCLYRAAELTLELGFDKFAVIERDGTQALSPAWIPTVPGLPDHPEKPSWPGGHHPWTPTAPSLDPRNLICESYMKIRLESGGQVDSAARDARGLLKEMAPLIARGD